MNTFVYFIELILMSLLGIMVYKLYIAYKAWKINSAFSAKSVVGDPALKLKPKQEQTSQFKGVALESLRHDYLSASKIGVSENRQCAGASQNAFDGALDNASDNALNSRPEKAYSASILDDYIGEFFPRENATTDSTITKPAVARNNETSVVSLTLETKEPVDDEFIKLESRSEANINVPGESLHQASLKSCNAMLNELSHGESDAFITVEPVNTQEHDKNKVMSDKVVLAMLDEAKLVRAS